MQGFLWRAVLESLLRGGVSWEEAAVQFTEVSQPFGTGDPVFLVLGKYQKSPLFDKIQALLRIDKLLTTYLTQFKVESLMPEEDTFAWLIQNKESDKLAASSNYLYALFESIQQRIGGTDGYAVSFVVGNAVTG